MRVPGFNSPRSTAETSSFVFTSYDADDNVLDYQQKGLVAKATEFHEIRTASFESTSKVVGESRANLIVTFETLDDLESTDYILVTIPKWNTNSNFPQPMITYDA